jgi:hypothetical protein
MSKTDRRFALDPASLERLDDIERTLRETFQMTPADTRPSTIMRRCIEAYAVHLQSVLATEDQTIDGFEITNELRQRIEAQSVRRHLRDNPRRWKVQAEVDRCKKKLVREYGASPSILSVTDATDTPTEGDE